MILLRPLLHGLLGASLLVLATSSAAADRAIACVGNSITYGYGLAWRESYPDRLDSLLGTGYAVSNFGVSGKTMVRASGDTYWSQTAFGNALASKPSDVVIELGTNDSKTYIWPTYGKDFATDYRAMIDTFRTLSPKPEVWLTLQPWANNASWTILDTTIAERVNPLIRAVAIQAGTHLIDLRAAFAGHKEWYLDDSVHPNAAGAEALAGVVRDMLLHAPVTFTDGGGALTATAGFGYAWYRNDTLLPRDTARTIPAPVTGSYKVSVKISAQSESRLVSRAMSVRGTGVARAPTAHLGVRATPSRDVVVVGSGTGDLPHLTLRDARGLAVSPSHVAPGVYHYRLSGPGIAQAGRITVP